MQLKKRMRAVVAVFAASMIGAMGLGFGASANAATGNPDLTQKGSITVHKYENPAWADAKNNGTVQNAPQGAKSINGIEFILQKVDGINLTDSAAWDIISKLTYTEGGTTAAAEGKTYKLGTEKKQTTANGGVTAFENLEAGVYLVREGNVGNNKIVKKAAPFFVSIPFPSKSDAGSEWLYDIHAYPKNTVSDDGTKTLNDADSRKVGDDAKWEIKFSLPALGANETYTRIGMEDELSPYLKYVDEEVTLGGRTLTKGTDYTVTVTNETKADNDVTDVQKVTVEVTETARAAAKANEEFKVILTTKITGLPANGEIANSFGPIVNDYKPGTSTTTNDRPIKVGDFRLKKQDKDGGAALKGAEFAIYASEADAKAGKNAIVTGTSGDNGEIVFTGLVLGDADSKNFWLKETNAPAGYVLVKDAKEITVTKGVSNSVELSIDNTKQTGPNLPLTGGTGQMLLTLGGVAVLAAAGGLTVKQVRRSRQSA